jgi:hypothetical protein
MLPSTEYSRNAEVRLDSRFLRNVLLKGIGLFLICNWLFAIWNPGGLGKFSLYNHLFPGRERFPFGENPAQSYNLSLFDLDAMFASHVIAGGARPADEYRLILIGDSSVWGILLRPDETLAGQLNAAGLTRCGKRVHAYNLGYPTISLMKDLLILDEAMRYQPDMVIWLVTLEAFPADKQLTTPLIANNPARVNALIRKFDLPFAGLSQPTLWERTIIGQRRALADLFRLQMYGVLWAATGVDQIYPTDYPRAQVDFETDASFHGWNPPLLPADALAFSVLEAGARAVGDTPLLLVNEPMLISEGENSDIRYNFFYPRWAYDHYRQRMAEQAQRHGWDYLDLWDLLPDKSNYTNSAIHLTPAAEALLARQIASVLTQKTCP